MTDIKPVQAQEAVKAQEAAKVQEVVKPQEAVKAKTKKKIVPAIGKVFIKSSFNNTIISITDERGHVISWASCGSVGFKGAKRGTPFAAQIASSNCAKKAVEMGLKQVSVFVKGPGSGREMAIRALQSSGLTVMLIKDVTPIPHNGCRPPKQRRV